MSSCYYREELLSFLLPGGFISIRASHHRKATDTISVAWSVLVPLLLVISSSHRSSWKYLFLSIAVNSRFSAKSYLTTCWARIKYLTVNLQFVPQNVSSQKSPCEQTSPALSTCDKCYLSSAIFLPQSSFKWLLEPETPFPPLNFGIPHSYSTIFCDVKTTHCT